MEAAIVFLCLCIPCRCDNANFDVLAHQGCILVSRRDKVELCHGRVHNILGIIWLDGSRLSPSS
jgi:hypothetical protein